ncbi:MULTISPECIES: hypothetical protein [unclassified Microbacterium]|uniref:hypothetical protein n=1 Tax=unclassified Microbacterium TaxID=2609290 RepID=UPI00203E60CC|nr:hypothetical protein [Microbacterium sp. USTB-Y]
MTATSSADTASLPLAPPHPPRAVPAHEHAWTTRSRHRTADGTLLYVQCLRCGAQRVDLQASGDAAPRALSRALDAPRTSGR